MTTISPFLRVALLIDLVGSGATALLLLSASGFLAPLFGLPAGLLWWVAIIMVPFLLLLGLTARRDSVPASVIPLIIALNLAWVAASALLLVSRIVTPTALGYGFVIGQAVAVALFAELQYVALRRAAAPAVSAI